MSNTAAFRVRTSKYEFWSHPGMWRLFVTRRVRRSAFDLQRDKDHNLNISTNILFNLEAYIYIHIKLYIYIWVCAYMSHHTWEKAVCELKPSLHMESANSCRGRRLQTGLYDKHYYCWEERGLPGFTELTAEEAMDPCKGMILNRCGEWRGNPEAWVEV